MPFIKNEIGKVCLALEPEVTPLLEKGWALLNESEEAAHRHTLALEHELTSYVGQERARVETGLYKALYPAGGVATSEQAAPADAGNQESSAESSQNE